MGFVTLDVKWTHPTNKGNKTENARNIVYYYYSWKIPVYCASFL